MTVLRLALGHDLSPAPPAELCNGEAAVANVALWAALSLFAAIGGVAHSSWRASAVGVYRLWRDFGYAVGALVAGLTADLLGLRAAMWLVAALTFASGFVVAVRMTGTRHRTASVG
jgi:hypothetical protein